MNGGHMISYGPIKLRPVEERDLEFLRDMMNDPDIGHSVVSYGFPVSAKAQREWFEKTYPVENAYRFIIEAEGRPVGTILLGKLDKANKTGELGYKIAAAYQGKSYAYNAVCAVTRYLFEEIGIERITVNHLDGNMGSRRIMEKAGYVYEGVQRSAVYKNGQRHDLVLWSCSREHYETIRKEMADI